MIDLSVRGKLQGARVTRTTVHKLSTVHPRGRAEDFRCLPSRTDDFQITAASPVVERFQPIRREADWYNCLPSIVASRQQSIDSLIVALISDNNVTEKDLSERQIDLLTANTYSKFASRHRLSFLRYFVTAWYM